MFWHSTLPVVEKISLKIGNSSKGACGMLFCVVASLQASCITISEGYRNHTVLQVRSYGIAIGMPLA